MSFYIQFSQTNYFDIKAKIYLSVMISRRYRSATLIHTLLNNEIIKR